VGDIFGHEQYGRRGAGCHTEAGAFRMQRLHTMVPESNKELWVLTEEADGRLMANIGAWPLWASVGAEELPVLGKHFNIDRKQV